MGTFCERFAAIACSAPDAEKALETLSAALNGHLSTRPSHSRRGERHAGRCARATN